MLGNKTMDHTAASGSVIFLENVYKTYGSKDQAPALGGVSLKVRPGEFVFITGRSGSGKTTLIRLLTRELKADQGEVYVLGEDLKKLGRSGVTALRRRLGIVFQDFRLLQDRTVYENVALAMRAVGTPGNQIPGRVEEVLAEVGLSDKKEAMPGQLSGGEQQKAALARALVNRPEIILADEPTGNLDQDSAREIMALLYKVYREGTTVLVVTHNREIIQRMQKRVITMDGGLVASDLEKAPGGKR